jgi:hypothetical protein
MALDAGVVDAMVDSGLDADAAADADAADADAGVDAAADAAADAGADADAGGDAAPDGGVSCSSPADCTAPGVMTADCVGGFCVIVACDANLGDCDSDFSTGCEADFLADPDHCGLCGGDCGLGGVCTAGSCDTVVDVTSGWEGACVTRSTGTVLCVGDNDSGELGRGVVGGVPLFFPRSFEPVMMISDGVSSDMGYELVCITRSDGSAACMGTNLVGQVGSGSTSTILTLPDAVSSLTDIDRVSAGGWDLDEGFACALRTGGAVSCWGVEFARGDGMTGNATTPVTVSGAADVVDVAAGRRHACLVRSGGEVACWGLAGSRLGAAGMSANLTVPTAVAGITNGTRVDATGGYTCAVRSTGRVACWGLNMGGRIGVAEATTAETATPVEVPSITNAVDVDIAPLWACALGAAGEVWCWGVSVNGALGGGPGIMSGPTPVRAVGLTATSLTAGAYGNCAITDDGAVACWGNEPSKFGAFGSLDVPTVLPAFPPTPVPP